VNKNLAWALVVCHVLDTLPENPVKRLGLLDCLALIAPDGAAKQHIIMTRMHLQAHLLAIAEAQKELPIK
jgi:hypothetical protein